MPGCGGAACRLYGGDGVIAEHDLLRSLRRLLLHHVLGLLGRADHRPVDVLVLSLGYYHERPEDAAFDAPLAVCLDALRSFGVTVVTSAGNDGEVRPLFPAAFAPHLDRANATPVAVDPATVPTDRPCLLAVGALNPDGSTALFSNDGPWVTCRRPGAALVSTFPVTFAGSIEASRDLAGGWPRERRATIDPDRFAGGFGTWSGTSFAGPVLAGELAQALLVAREDGRVPPAPGPDWAGGVAARVKAAWGAITATTGLRPGA